MTDFGALTMVGLIATVLSIGFAFAAFINSRRCKVNKLEKTKDKDGPPGLPFLAPGEQTPGNVGTAHAPYYSTVSRRVSGGEQTSKPAFKQAQVLGVQSGKKDSFNSDEYLWE